MSLPVYSKGYAPTAAGVQNPGKYPFTGANYKIWGEQPGWLYYPWNDRYVPDPNATKTYGTTNGLIEAEKKPETISPNAQLGSQALLAVAPIAAKGLTSAIFGGGEKEAAKGAGESIWGSIKDMLSGGESASSGAAVPTTPAGPSASGLQSLGANSVSEVAADAPWFGEGGSFFNTSGMYNDGGMFGASSDGMSLSNLGPGNYAGAAAGAYGVYDATKKQDKTSGIAQGALSGAAAGTSILPGWGTLGGAILGGLLGATAHETTKHRTGRRYDELAGTSSDAAFQKLLSEGREMSLSGKDTWDIGDDKASAPVDLMSKSYGVLKAFGPTWANYSPEQQQKVVRELVNNDLVNSKQGEWLVDDVEKANQILTSVAGAPAGAAPAGVTPTVTAQSSGTSGTGRDITAEDLADIVPYVEMNAGGEGAQAAAPVLTPAVDPTWTPKQQTVPPPIMGGLLANQAVMKPLNVKSIGQNLGAGLLRFS